MIIRKIILNLLTIIGWSITIPLPLYLAYSKIFKMIPNKNTVDITWAIILGLVSIVYFKYAKKWVGRKLSARATTDEFGTQGYTSPIWIRFLVIFEIGIPLLSITLLFYCLSLIPGLDIWKHVLWLMGFQAIAQVVLLFRDILKHHWMIYHEALKKYKVDKKLDSIKQRISVK